MSLEKKQLTKKSKDISRWYLDLMELAELADYAPVKGTIVFRPYSYAIWERMQQIFDAWIKKDGVKNAYFPLFIPYSLLQKEKQHIQGFSPELAIVTIGGGEELAEKLVVRPTSETIMYSIFAKWLKSYQDLPLKINQWCSVIRWEKRTYPFLRTMEFLWQEGHTAHLEKDQAEEMTLKALHWYERLYKDYYALHPLIGMKSQSEKFAGALRTYSIETLIENGKALQAATSHNLGQNFSKAFQIRVLDRKNTLQYVWQTSWGLSTRSLGALFLGHGDDYGLILPPKIAPIQIIILPIEKKEKLIKKAEEIKEKLKKTYRIQIDTNFNKGLGWRRNHWEIKGVPLRLEIGEKELEEKFLTVVNRLTLKKTKEKESTIYDAIGEILEQTQQDLYEKSRRKTEDLIVQIADKQEFLQALKEKKLVRAHWCEDPACEKQIKEETKATTRVIELDQIKKKSSRSCFFCGKKAERLWVIGRAY